MPKLIFTYLPFHLIYLSIKFYFLLIFCKYVYYNRLHVFYNTKLIFASKIMIFQKFLCKVKREWLCTILFPPHFKLLYFHRLQIIRNQKIPFKIFPTFLRIKLFPPQYIFILGVIQQQVFHIELLC